MTKKQAVTLQLAISISKKHSYIPTCSSVRLSSRSGRRRKISTPLQVGQRFFDPWTIRQIQILRWSLHWSSRELFWCFQRLVPVTNRYHWIIWYDVIISGQYALYVSTKVGSLWGVSTAKYKNHLPWKTNRKPLQMPSQTWGKLWKTLRRFSAHLKTSQYRCQCWRIFVWTIVSQPTPGKLYMPPAVWLSCYTRNSWLKKEW